MAHLLSPQQAALGPDRAGPGWLDRIDPRARIVAATGFAIAVVACSRLEALALAFAIPVALLLSARLPLRRTLARMAAMDGFILFMLVLLPFTTPGEPMVTLWGFAATWRGLALAIEIALTANAAALAMLVLLGTMEPVTLGHALSALRAPERLVLLLMVSIRYIGVLRAEYLRLRVAMKLRGFRPGANLHSYRSFGYLVGMMLVRAVERSERVLEAMKCRGFAGRMPMLEEFRFGRADLVFGVGALGAVCCLLLLEFAPWR